jgi:hypothetical protein
MVQNVSIYVVPSSSVIILHCIVHLLGRMCQYWYSIVNWTPCFIFRSCSFYLMSLFCSRIPSGTILHLPVMPPLGNFWLILFDFDDPDYFEECSFCRMPWYVMDFLVTGLGLWVFESKTPEVKFHFSTHHVLEHTINLIYDHFC